MEAVIMKSLSKDPRERYFSANAMLDAIEMGPPPGTTETPGPARRKVRRGGLVLACGIALLLLLGGGAALASGLIDVPQNGSVADTLSRMNPAETPQPPPPPQGSSEAARENAGQSGNKNVASVTEAASRQDAQDQRQMVPVPNVWKYYDYYAADTLTNSGFKVDYVREYRSGYAPRGVTWATDPAAGTPAPEGSTVTVYATPKDLPLPPRLR
jgi:serine/threonine-protein kinase